MEPVILSRRRLHLHGAIAIVNFSVQIDAYGERHIHEIALGVDLNESRILAMNSTLDQHGFVHPHCQPYGHICTPVVENAIALILAGNPTGFDMIEAAMAFARERGAYQWYRTQMCSCCKNPTNERDRCSYCQGQICDDCFRQIAPEANRLYPEGAYKRMCLECLLFFKKEMGKIECLRQREGFATPSNRLVLETQDLF